MALVACPTEDDDKGAGGEGPTAITSFVAMPTDIAEDGGESTVTLTVNRAIPMDGSDLTFPYTIGGTGITVDDITADSLTGSITVEAGSATGTLTITAVDDVMPEGAGETMTITLGALPSGITATGIDGEESIFITDNDSPPVGIPTEVRGFRAAPTEITEDANGTPSATVTLTLDATLPSGATPLSFPYAIAGAGITLDDLTAPSSLTGSITVEAGSATGTLTITAADDDRDEDAESLTITLGALPMNANTIMLTYSTGIDGEESITITDNDDPNLPPSAPILSSDLTPILFDIGNPDPNLVVGTIIIDTTSIDPEGDAVTYRLATDTDSGIPANDNGLFSLTGSAPTFTLTLTGTVDSMTRDDYSIVIVADDGNSVTAAETIVLPVVTVGIAGSGHDTLFGTADDGPVLSGDEVIGEGRSQSVPLNIGTLRDVSVDAGETVAFTLSTDSTDGMDGTFVATATHSTGAVFSMQTIDGEPALIFTPPSVVGSSANTAPGAGDYSEPLGSIRHPTYAVWVKATVTDSDSQTREQVREYDLNLYDRVLTFVVNSDSDPMGARDFHITIGHTWIRLINNNIFAEAVRARLRWGNDANGNGFDDDTIFTPDNRNATLDLFLGDPATISTPTPAQQIAIDNGARFVEHGLIFRGSPDSSTTISFTYRTGADFSSITSGATIFYNISTVSSE